MGQKKRIIRKLNATPGYLKALLRSLLTPEETKSLGAISKMNKSDLEAVLKKYESRIQEQHGLSLHGLVKTIWPSKKGSSYIPFIVDGGTVEKALQALRKRYAIIPKQGIATNATKLPSFEHSKGEQGMRFAEGHSVLHSTTNSLIFKYHTTVTQHQEIDEDTYMAFDRKVYFKAVLLETSCGCMLLCESASINQAKKIVYGVLKGLGMNGMRSYPFHEGSKVLAQNLRDQEITLERLATKDPEGKLDELAFTATADGELLMEEDERIARAEEMESVYRGYRTPYKHFDQWSEQGLLLVSFFKNHLVISFPKKASQPAMEQALSLVADSSNASTQAA